MHLNSLRLVRSFLCDLGDTDSIHLLIMRPLILGLVVEFKKIALATGIGFAVMGFIGFFVKLIHIPINNIIVGGNAV